MTKVRQTATVIGSGPNGLSAAIVLAQAGLDVTVYEARNIPGGGASSQQLTLPGYVHDFGSAVHPMALASPFFHSLDLPAKGLRWIQPPAPLAHPMPDGTAVMLHQDIQLTAEDLGADGKAWRKLFQPLVENWNDIKTDVLGPIGFPRHPFKMARFGMYALRSTHGLVDHFFKHPRARALFAGVAAHSVLTFDHAISAAIPLVLTTAAHAVGWPIPAGGAQSITTALIKVLEAYGGSVRCNHRADEAFLMARLAESPRALLCDVTPRQLIRLASGRLPAQYRKQLASFRYGPGVYKVDWALNGPIPWTAKECLSAGTVHLGGTFEEIARSEKAAWSRQPSDNPFVLLTQPSLFDPQRAPDGCHTAWAYCHVPNGSSTPMLERVERQIERFAPGFRERVLARHIATPADLERENENLIGGDIVGGISNMTQMLFRPTRSLYATPIRNLFLCSSSTPPGGGVHGMCGYHAARMALNF